MRPLALAFFAALLVAGCSSTTSSDGDASVADLARVKAPDLAVPLSSCGHPGDPGNSLGVGKFCTHVADCMGDNTKTNICSSLGNGSPPSADDTYFCTIYPCHADAGVSECGENATCVCGSGGGMTGCACTPNSCLGPTDAGAPVGHAG